MSQGQYMFVKRREWPKYATGPNGERCRFDSRGDVLVDWILDGETEPANPSTPAEAKRGPGRPRKDVAA